MGAITPAQWNAFLKVQYSGNQPQNLAIHDSKILRMLTKGEDLVGQDAWVIPVQDGITSNASATDTIALAQANVTAGSKFAFTLTRSPDFTMSTVTSELFLASKGNKAGWGEARKKEVDGMFELLGRRMHKQIWSDKGIALGRALTSSTDVITLTDPQDVYHFTEGQQLTVSATATGATPRTITGTTILVESVDYDAGTITVDDISDVAAFDNDNDYFFAYGDATKAPIVGIPMWIPAVAPDSTAFFGVDRTINMARRSGHRLTALGPVEDAIIRLAARIRGGKQDCAFISNNGFVQLTKELESRGIYPKNGENKRAASFGLKSIELVTPRGNVEVYPENDVPEGYVWLLDLSTWKLHHLGALPHFIPGGSEMMAVEGSAAIASRAERFAQLACDAPGWNGVVRYA
jgi:hypothetical protein